MKCSGCKFYVKSKVYGNSCSCRGVKPCDLQRNKVKRNHHSKIKKTKKEKFNSRKYENNSDYGA